MDSLIVPFSTDKASGLFIKLPADAEDGAEIRGRSNHDTQLLSFFGHSDTIELPNGNYTILGIADKLSEVDWMKIVDSQFDTFRNYKDVIIESSFYLSATESGKSLMESLNIYSVNPLGERPIKEDYEYVISSAVIRNGEKHNKGLFLQDLNNWEKAQYRTGTFLLLIETTKTK